jgi:hypothetical protein
MAGTGFRTAGQNSYDETIAESSPLVIDQGYLLMPKFLGP